MEKYYNCSRIVVEENICFKVAEFCCGSASFKLRNSDFEQQKMLAVSSPMTCSWSLRIVGVVITVKGRVVCCVFIKSFSTTCYYSNA